MEINAQHNDKPVGGDAIKVVHSNHQFNTEKSIVQAYFLIHPDPKPDTYFGSGEKRKVPLIIDNKFSLFGNQVHMPISFEISATLYDSVRYGRDIVIARRLYRNEEIETLLRIVEPTTGGDKAKRFDGLYAEFAEMPTDAESSRKRLMHLLSIYESLRGEPGSLGRVDNQEISASNIK